MKINDVAKLAGVTVRTLHYYDEIGLLVPSETTESGYRMYDEKNISKLQQIMFFRELDFKLSQIKEIMNSPGFDKEEALIGQKNLLRKKKDRLDKLINLIDNSIKGDETMSFKEFDITEIEETKKRYEKEVKERWGNTDEFAQSQKKTSKYKKEDWKKIQEESDKIFKQFAASMDKTPDDIQIQSLVKKWQEHITKNFYDCSDEILKNLGHMYAEDERFKENIDRHGEGLAEFISEAISYYCDNKI